MPSHTIYLAARPVDSIAQTMRPIHNMLKGGIVHRGLVGHLSRIIEDVERATLLVAAHVAVVINGHWFHLKKMPDNHLGLDLTPFNPDTEFYHVPVCRTTMSYDQSLGLALCVLSRMSGNRRPDKVPISLRGKSKTGLKFDRSKFIPDFLKPNTDNGLYSITNNCVRFAYEFVWQAIHNSITKNPRAVHDFVIEILGVHTNDPHHKEDGHSRQGHHKHHHKHHEHHDHHVRLRWHVGDFKNTQHLLDHFLNVKIARQ